MNEIGQKLRGGQFAVWLVSEYQSINFTLAARVQGSFTLDQFRLALNKLQHKYPPITMRLKRGSSRSVYIIADPGLEIPIRIVDREHTESWVEEVTRELGQVFDLYNSVPIRLVWLRGESVSEIIFTCPHAMADGLSVAYLVRDFLMFLGNPDSDSEPMRPIPAMSEILPEFAGKQIIIWQSRLKSALMRIFLKFGAKPEIPMKKQGDYCLFAWELTPQQTAALVIRSRAEKTTVHAALSTAFLRAFGELKGDGWKRKLQSPVDLRKRLNSPVGEAFGLFVNLAEIEVNCSPKRDFWEVARDIKQTFIQLTKDKNIFRSLIEANIMMDAIGPSVSPETVASSFMTVAYDLSITNLGRLVFPTQSGPLHLDALYGPSLGGNPEDIVLGVNTIGEKMHFTLSFTSLKLNASQAQQIRETAMSWLERATGW